MLLSAAWILLVLGIAHVPYGLIWLRVPFQAAFTEGFIGKFSGIDARRFAFWFTIFGPALAMGGHAALRAVWTGDYVLIRIIGFYLLAIAIIGVLALPKSPMWLLLLLAPVFIAGGYGWIA